MMKFSSPVEMVLDAAPGNDSESRFQERVKADLATVARFCPEREQDARAGTVSELTVMARIVTNGKTPPPRRDAVPPKVRPAPTPPPAAKPTPAASIAPKRTEPAAPWRPNREQCGKIARALFGPTSVLDAAADDGARAMLDRLLFQGHLTAPWMDQTALAAKHWRPDPPTGLARTIRAERQKALDRLLKTMTTSPAK